MNHSLYEPEDFASDESYLRYYFKLDEADVVSWQDWIRNHPQYLDVITNADQLIDLLVFNLSEDELQREYARIIHSVKEQTGQGLFMHSSRARGVSETPKVRIDRKPLVYILAAAVVFIVSIVLILIHTSSTSTRPSLANYSVTTTKRNNGSAAERIVFHDGSMVLLQPGAAITYPSRFLPNSREVILDGDGFFDVAKNPSSPFYVYQDQTVTHVLGTSFWIRKDKSTGRVEVSVRTGRVEVYTTAGSNRKPEAGVVLTPNQKVIYSPEDGYFKTTLVDDPFPIQKHRDTVVTKEVYTDNFNPAQTVSVKDLLGSLENTYGIKIELENESMNDCHFSGDISNIGLYQKLDIICQAINASYERRELTILIKGKGCR